MYVIYHSISEVDFANFTLWFHWNSAAEKTECDHLILFLHSGIQNTQEILIFFGGGEFNTYSLCAKN